MDIKSLIGQLNIRAEEAFSMVDRSNNVSFVIHQMAHGVLISDVIIVIGKVRPNSMVKYLNLTLTYSLVYSDTHLNIYYKKNS